VTPRRAAGSAALLGLLAWGCALLRLRGDVARRRDYWSAPSPGRSDDDLVYVALGDSAAQGVGASRPEGSYVAVLARRIGATTGRPVRVHNLSVSGATVGDVVRDQLPRLAGLDPDVVTVAAGGNDVRGYDAARFRAEVTALLDGLPATAVVADVPYFGGGRGERIALEAGEVLAQEAQARGLRVARLHDAMAARGRRGMLTGYAADRFHPNDRGYVVWADALEAALRRAPSLLPESVIIARDGQDGRVATGCS
jgi:acyl-CoA thioesterase I